jgi:Family of unknown function (DUF5670)
MVLTIVVILIVLWVVGFGFFRAAVGGMIHILLLIAIIALAWYFLSGRARTANPAPANPTSFNARPTNSRILS